jgi:hypothetical protein
MSHSQGPVYLCRAIEKSELSGSLFVSFSQGPRCLCETVQNRELSGSPFTSCPH